MFTDTVEVVVIIADGDIDSVAEWNKETVQHVKDLREMGCTVKLKLFQDIGQFTAWERAERFEDNYRG